MENSVNCDCRPGDLIRLIDLDGKPRNARVTDTYPKGVRIEWLPDGSPQWFTYERLKAFSAYYVAKCEPVDKPAPFAI